MSHQSVRSQDELDQFCRRLVGAERIGFDTEFVSEDTFYPELCLIQVVTDDLLAIIDPYTVDDLTPFWDLLASEGHDTIVHAAREELNFSLRAIDAAPANLFDTQVAAGLVGTEYPSSFGSVVSKFLGKRVAKGEQRTDWRRRPLSDEQINYALEDVRYLLPLHDTLSEKMTNLGRVSWMDEEMMTLLQEVDEARSRQRWRRVSGIGNLSARSLAIVREVWIWRQEEAKRRNIPAKRVLRDDLIVELARRKTDNPEKIRAVRGMQRGGPKSRVDELAICVRRGLEAPTSEISRSSKHQLPPQLNLLGQFLTPALNTLCRESSVATSLAGTATDVRDFIAHRLNFNKEQNGDLPVLAQGWRAELIGSRIDDLLLGKRSIRIVDPHSEYPLGFDEVET